MRFEHHFLRHFFQEAAQFGLNASFEDSLSTPHIIISHICIACQHLSNILRDYRVVAAASSVLLHYWAGCTFHHRD